MDKWLILYNNNIIIIIIYAIILLYSYHHYHYYPYYYHCYVVYYCLQLPFIIIPTTITSIILFAIIDINIITIINNYSCFLVLLIIINDHFWILHSQQSFLITLTNKEHLQYSWYIINCAYKWYRTQQLLRKFLRYPYNSCRCTSIENL